MSVQRKHEIENLGRKIMKRKISTLRNFVLWTLITNCVYAAEKDFDFFEDCLGTNIYCNFNLAARNPSHEEKGICRICER